MKRPKRYPYITKEFVVTAKKVCTATITAKAGYKSATCAVTVKDNTIEDVGFEDWD